MKLLILLDNVNMRSSTCATSSVELRCICYNYFIFWLLQDLHYHILSRISDNSSLDKKMITKSYLFKIKELTKIANKRGQSLPQMALSWILRHPTMTSALIGARTVKQLDECLDSQNNLTFSNSELKEIDKYAKEEKINLWAKSSTD